MHDLISCSSFNEKKVFEVVGSERGVLRPVPNLLPNPGSVKNPRNSLLPKFLAYSAISLFTAIDL